jgi:competence protein ComEA
MNQWLEQHRTLVLGAVGALIVVGVLAVLVRWRPPEPITIEPPAPTATPAPIRVYVSGAVLHADVYDLSPDSIAQDALTAAGGASGDANLDAVNLARPLSDGDQVYVPHVGEVVTPLPQEGGGAAPAASGPVNINTADQAALESLPGIGPALAQRIIEYREANGPFASIEDIQNVSGVGPATFEGFRDLIVAN